MADLGDLIDKLTELKVQRQFHEKESEKFKTLMTEVEVEILRVMADQKLEKAAHGGTAVAPREHVYPHVENWEQFYAFILENRYLHLLDKRVSVTGFRELIELGRIIPGVIPFVQTKLSVTKATR